MQQQRTWVLVAGLWAATACGGSTDDGGSGGGSSVPGTAQPGEPCRAHADCAPVAGREVECRCTDAAAVPVCDLLREAGESCDITGSFQPKCRTGTACVVVDLQSNPVCVPTVGKGQACTSTEVACEPALTCTDGACAPGALGPGADCFDDFDCQAEYRCDFSAGCGPRIATGQSCESVGVPTSKTCVDGAGCEESSGTCVTLKADGAACFWDEECRSGECFFDGCGHDYRLPANVHYGCGLL